MEKDKASSMLGDFILNNAKAIFACVVFICTFYIQYQSSMLRIDQMEKEISSIKSQVNDQYMRLDNIKLDKAVFEATMQSFTEMSTDIRQIRDRLEDMLSDHQHHTPQQQK